MNIDIIEFSGDRDSKKKMTVTFEHFQRVTRAIVMHLRQLEDSVQDGKLVISQVG